MTFPTYPEYKHSGVEWLGEVPAHWSTVPLKWIVELVTKKADSMCNPVGLEHIEGWTGKFVDSEADYSGNGIAFEPNDILFGKLRPYLAKVYRAESNGEAIGDFFVIRPRSINSRFLQFYILNQEVISELNASTIGAKMPRVGWRDMGSLPIATPSVNEQIKIETFLEQEISKVDALIEEQQRLIELLNEKRQAVISHAVTKGLDPDVPMKDSGVEWLGEVPARWGVVPLGLLAEQIQTGPFGSQLHSHEYVEGGVPVINPSNIIDGRIVPDMSSTVTPNVVERLSHQQLREGEIVVGRRGEMGRCAVVTSSEAGWLCGTGSMKIVLSDRIDPIFACLFIRTPLIRGLLQIESVGSTMDNLNPEILSRIRIPLPPIQEQRFLIEKVSLAADETQTLIGEALRGSKLLQERRAALISAAVTGKIDVRGWQAPPGLPSCAEATATGAA